MRLIDADKVKEYILTEGAYCDTQADKEYTAKRLDELFPTVKAIPIEWIEKYIWRADTHEEKRALRKMYIAWEKENEAN